MIFDTVRRSWHEERFKNHWAKISNLLGDRRDLESRGRKDMVLAVNYELVSHATRAQEALRKAEELGLELTKKADDVRELLSHLIELPALARAELETTRKQQIDRLYSEYLDHQRSSPLQDMDSDRSESQTADDDSGVSEAEVRRALNDQAQERLEEFDERTALLLVSKLRAQALESGMEVRGVSLAKRPRASGPGPTG